MGTRLFVGNLSFDATEDALLERFAADGRKVVRVRLMLDRETGRSRGFAFVDMATEDDMFAAIEALDGTPLAGRPMRVSEAMERDAADRGERRPGVERPRAAGDRPQRPVGDRPPNGRDRDDLRADRASPAVTTREPDGERSERIASGPSSDRSGSTRGVTADRDGGRGRDSPRFGPDKRRGAWRDERKDERGGKRGIKRPPPDDDDGDLDDDWE